MQYLSLTPNLMVDDVNAMVDFYCTTLGLELRAKVPESGRYNWAMVGSGGLSLMFQTRESLVDELPQIARYTPPGAFTMYASVSGVEELYERIREKVTVAVEPHTTFYGAREFVIEDPSGYFVCFAEMPS
jgi:uncharacterized glyoxalase superfamily protein PhnB